MHEIGLKRIVLTAMTQILLRFFVFSV